MSSPMRGPPNTFDNLGLEDPFAESPESEDLPWSTASPGSARSPFAAALAWPDLEEPAARAEALEGLTLEGRDASEDYAGEHLREAESEWNQYADEAETIVAESALDEDGEAVWLSAEDSESFDSSETMEAGETGGRETRDQAAGFDRNQAEAAASAHEWESALPEALDRSLEFTLSTEFEELVAKPAQPRIEETREASRLLVVDDSNQPLIAGEYAFYQGTQAERGRFSAERAGRAYLGRIDPAKPFLFEVRDRVCAIRAGAYIDPDDPHIEYGGTWFDWSRVRDDKDPERSFWPHYQREMDAAFAAESRQTTIQRRVDRFLQHEHLTRRPMRIAKPYLSQLSKLRICAVPARIRVGPFVRYTDRERAVIWLETVSPCMVRIRCRKSGAASERPHHASTVRVGGRHFAAVEIVGLEEHTFYDYTVELAPLPAAGARIPVEQADFGSVFPPLTAAVRDDMKRQCAAASLSDTEWLSFRTLRATYNDRLRFATGSCRWYPGDKNEGKDWGPDMLHGLGDWLRVHAKAKDQWPAFLFFGGDQIYSDEIGDDHGEMLAQGRFASRVPGPADPSGTLRGKLVDGAWAGRFAHRYKSYQDPPAKLVERTRENLKSLDVLYRKHPEIRNIYLRYPETGSKESRELAYELMSALTRALGGKVNDQKVYDKAKGILRTVDKLNLESGSFRAFLPHWKAGFSPATRRNPMGRRYLSHNFVLWQIPDFEEWLPSVFDSGNVAVVQPNVRGHRSVAGALHAADFAEYAYLYERAWTTSRGVRALLAHVPTFLMLDDHEVTDDWNFDVSWARMLHNRKDALRMWPKTLTDGLVAYWVYQGWCNKAQGPNARSRWNSEDPRIKALTTAQRNGSDALPALRRCIHDACFMPLPPPPPSNPNDPKETRDPKYSYQTGLSLDWHYQLPFDPPFLVPDCRTRKRMVPADDDMRSIDHDNPAQAPLSQSIDHAQLEWIRKALLGWRGGTVAFLAPSTPLLLQKKVMDIMTKPETASAAWDKGDPGYAVATALNSTRLGFGSNRMLRVFRRGTDLEHMIRDRNWRDLWGIAEGMHKAQSPVKTLVLVSGDVHHNYAMTANLPGAGRPKPELLQITCSGLQTTIREERKEKLASALGLRPFDVGKYRLRPGFMQKNGSGPSLLALYQNTVAMVDVRMKPEVDIAVTYMSGAENFVFRYSSAAAYLKNGESVFSPWHVGK